MIYYNFGLRFSLNDYFRKSRLLTPFPPPFHILTLLPYPPAPPSPIVETRFYRGNHYNRRQIHWANEGYPLFYPARMKKVTILTHSDFNFPLTQELHRSGLMQIDPMDAPDLEKWSPERTHIEDISSRLDSILDAIQHDDSPPIADQLLHPQPPELFHIQEKSESELRRDADSLLPGIEKEITSLEGKLNSIRERISRLEDRRVELLPLQGMDLDISHLGKGDYSIIIPGTTRDLEGLLEMLESKLIHVYHEGTKGQFTIVIIAHSSQDELVEKARRQRFFDKIDLDFILGEDDLQGKPRDILSEIDTELISIRDDIPGIEEEMQKLYKENREQLLILRDEFTVRLDRYRIFDNYGVTKTTTGITGWVPEEDEEEFSALCEEATQGCITIEFEKPEGNEAPTKLENPLWAKPFEVLINMFSPPKYNEIDPTMVVGVLFITFFGIMVGDAGYGIVILALGLAGKYHIGKYSSEIREYAYYGILMGVATIIFGVLFGGFFYDSVPRFINGDETQLLYPTVSILSLSFPLDPMLDPMSIFVFSLFTGIATLNIGIAMSAYAHIHEKDYNMLIRNDVSWVFLQFGGIALVGGLMIGAWELSSGMMILSLVTALLGIILRITVSGGLVMFDITGYAGNVLSFARLLALGLATAGLALTINIFTNLTIDFLFFLIPFMPLVILLAFIFFIFVHIINTALQALGAGIHSLRLQYVELFSMFYDGGGKHFKPFKVDRIWTEITEQETVP